MSNTLEKLKTVLQNGEIDLARMSELEAEYRELQHRADQFEKLLIMLVRTGWPWDEEGAPNAIAQASKGGFCSAMQEAHDLLGLNYRSMVTRTEPRT